MAAKLPIETIAAIILFIVIAYILVGPYLLGFVKGSILKWSAPNIAEANSYSLALCEYRQGRAEYPFQWSSKSDGTLNLIAAGLSDCEWARKLKLDVDVKSGPEITSCKTLPTPEPVSSCADAGGTCRIYTTYYCYGNENDAGDADCGTGTHCCIVPTSVNAYLARDPLISDVAVQYLISYSNTYKIIAERTSDANMPDVCMCLTTDLQRHECW